MSSSEPKRSPYFDALTEAMTMLAFKRQRAIFIGQAVACGGTTMMDTLARVPARQRMEFPVAEDMQMGAAIGLSLEGWLPICIYPRWNFLLLAANQLVNHLDRLPLYSDGGYRPKVIIRVAAPSIEPFYPGPQHDDDFTAAFRLMLRTVSVIRLSRAEDVLPSYRAALEAHESVLLVEHTALYNAPAAKPVEQVAA